MVKNISDFCSPSMMRSEINAVLVTPDRIVATDSFKLIEIKKETGAGAPVLVKLPKGVKTFDTITYKKDDVGTFVNGAWTEIGTPLDADIYPKYEAIMPTGEPLKKVRLSVHHLKAIITACEGKGRDRIDLVDISVYAKEYGPVKFERVRKVDENETVTMLLMPVNNY